MMLISNPSDPSSGHAMVGIIISLVPAPISNTKEKFDTIETVKR